MHSCSCSSSAWRSSRSAPISRYSARCSAGGWGAGDDRGGPPDAKRGRPPVPIERDPRRFEIACIWAFLGFGLGPFDATNRALMVVRGGPISMADVMGVLRLSQMPVPLPEAEDEPNAAERRLFAMAKRRRAEPW